MRKTKSGHPLPAGVVRVPPRAKVQAPAPKKSKFRWWHILFPVGMLWFVLILPLRIFLTLFSYHNARR